LTHSVPRQRFGQPGFSDKLPTPPGYQLPSVPPGVKMAYFSFRDVSLTFPFSDRTIFACNRHSSSLTLLPSGFPPKTQNLFPPLQPTPYPFFSVLGLLFLKSTHNEFLSINCQPFSHDLEWPGSQRANTPSDTPCFSPKAARTS